MRYWDTKDVPTNANLSYLESLAQFRSEVSADEFTNRVCAVITIEKMLPKAVRRHFSFPNLIIGASAYDWTPTTLEKRVAELRDAIGAGLDSVRADATLKEDGDANLSDRPPTKGEELQAATEQFGASRGYAELSQLRQAIYGTSLRHLMDRLDKWLARKRPSRGRSIEYEIVSALGDIRRRARDYHHLPASHRYADQLASARTPQEDT